VITRTLETDFKEAKQKITTNVEKNPSLIEQSKIIDFNMVYKSAFIGIQEIEVESTDAAKIGQKEKNYQYQTLWGSTDPNGIGEQLLSSTSLLAENSEEDTRDIYIRNIRPVKHSEFICKKGKNDLDYSTRHTWKYPLILYLTKNNEEYRTLPYTNEKSLDHPDLSHCKICMVLTRPLRFRSFSRPTLSRNTNSPPRQLQRNMPTSSHSPSTRLQASARTAVGPLSSTIRIGCGFVL
jgi:hypothetical protein